MANVVTIFGDINRLMKFTPNITYDNLMIILHVSRMTILRDINLLRSLNKLKREGGRKACRRRAESCFDMDRCADRYLEIFESYRQL